MFNILGGMGGTAFWRCIFPSTNKLEIMRPVSDSIKITVGIPARVLSPNTRCHWAMKAKATKSARIESWASTQIAMNGMKGNWIAAECQVYWYARDSRVRDRDNCLASLKATFDGLKDGGLLKDDSGLIHLPLRLFVDSKNPRVELFLTKIEITEASK